MSAQKPCGNLECKKPAAPGWPYCSPACAPGNRVCGKGKSRSSGLKPPAYKLKAQAKAVQS